MTKWFALALTIVATLVTMQACTDPSTSQVALLTDSTRWQELEQAIPMLMDSAGTPGLSVAITTDSGVVWGKGFGVGNTETGDPVDT